MLTVLGIVLIVVFSIQIYKAARDTGRNALLWTLIAVFASIFLMIFVPLGIGIVIGIYLLITGTDPAGLSLPFGVGLMIEILMIAATAVTLFLMLRQASKLKDEPYDAAPPPPTFG